jgi:excisionase family DNA binding protein
MQHIRKQPLFTCENASGYMLPPENKKKRTDYQVRKLEANPQRINSDPGALLNKHDVAGRLEVNVQTVLKWARSGDLEAIRLGHRTVRFTQAAVAKFLARKGR